MAHVRFAFSCAPGPVVAVVVAITLDRGRLASTVKKLLVIVPLLRMFAMCIARD